MADSPCSIEALATSNCGLRVPPPGHTLSPWVRATFQISGVELTVGNQSSPSLNNHAVIKDFELGYSNGVRCRITIMDEMGSSFERLMEDLLKDFKCAKPTTNTTMHVQFGWVMANCPSGDATVKSIVYKILATSIEANFRGGKFFFVIEGVDITSRIQTDHHEDLVFRNMPITQAIRKMLTASNEPSVAAVDFKRLSPDGKAEEDIIWKDTQDTEGPRSGNQGWHSNGENRLAAALRWIKPYLTNHDKSVTAMYDPTVEGGRIIFWEDGPPECGETRMWDQLCLGTYIVNGGKKSPVIEFNPKIQWDFLSLSNSGGGTAMNKAGNADGGKIQGPPLCPPLQRPELKNAGPQNTVTVSNDAKDNKGKDAMEAAAKGQAQQARANYRFAFHGDIEAELVIVGDPVTFDPLMSWNKNIKIIMLNPYFIFENGDGSHCGDWSANPICNAVLTNKAWMIKSVNHRISEGKYTTTINVFLLAPGVLIEPDAPLGGGGSGGWRPTFTCS